jgi:pilus assembly protein CpaF
MASEFRNRLRQQSGKNVPADQQEAQLNGADCVSELMAWEASVPDVLYETRTKLNPMEIEWREKIYQQLLKVMDLSLLDTLEPADAARQIREISQRLLDEHSAPVSASSRQLIIKQITDEVLGLGPLEPLLADPSVSDILVNGHASVYVERFGKLQRTDVRFRDDQHLLNIIDRIVSSLGRRIDESSPLVDARLKDGSRVNAIIPPLAIDGPSMSIRGGFAQYRESGADGHLDSGHRTDAQGYRPWAAERADLRWYRQWQDHHAQCTVQLHSA